MSPGRRPMGRRPAKVSARPTSAITTPSTISMRPKSCMTDVLTRAASLKQRALAGRGGGRWLLAQVRVGLARHAPAPRLPGDEADLEQVRFHDLRERFGLVVDGGRHRLDADGAA